MRAWGWTASGSLLLLVLGVHGNPSCTHPLLHALHTPHTLPRQIKEMLADPSKFAAAAPAAAAPASPGKGKTAAKKEVVVEDKEESDDDMGFGLFD